MGIVIGQYFSLEEGTRFTEDARHGAQAAFIGYIRNHNEGKDVHGLT